MTSGKAITAHHGESNRKRASERSAESVVLRDALRTRLAAYVASAGSAAAALMLAAPSAGAQIVYTPVHKTITCGLEACSQAIFIDLNHDGVQDFQLSVDYLAGEQWDEVAARGKPGEQAEIAQGYYGSAVVLPFGARIGGAGEYFQGQGLHGGKLPACLDPMQLGLGGSHP
jgi:hypothetical protein